MSLSARARACRSCAAAGKRLIERRQRRRGRNHGKKFRGIHRRSADSIRLRAHAFGGLRAKIGQRKSRWRRRDRNSARAPDFPSARRSGPASTAHPERSSTWETGGHRLPACPRLPACGPDRRSRPRATRRSARFFRPGRCRASGDKIPRRARDPDSPNKNFPRQTAPSAVQELCGKRFDKLVDVVEHLRFEFLRAMRLRQSRRCARRPVRDRSAKFRSVARALPPDCDFALRDAQLGALVIHARQLRKQACDIRCCASRQRLAR